MKTRTAAFIRVEGVLLERGALALSAFYASNAAGFSERLFRLGQVALSAPLFGAPGGAYRGLASRMAYGACRGLSEDRLILLGEEFFDRFVRDRILESGRALLARLRREGHEVVLLSELPAQVIAPLSELLGPAELICNQLELRAARATGRLLEPVVGGRETGRIARDYARERGLDLQASVACGGREADLLLLAAVGQPCAINPDSALRRSAREADWPVVDYSA